MISNADGGGGVVDLHSNINARLMRGRFLLNDERVLIVGFDTPILHFHDSGSFSVGSHSITLNSNLENGQIKSLKI